MRVLNEKIPGCRDVVVFFKNSSSFTPRISPLLGEGCFKLSSVEGFFFMFPRLQSVSCHDGISVESILCF